MVFGQKSVKFVKWWSSSLCISLMIEILIHSWKISGWKRQGQLMKQEVRNVGQFSASTPSSGSDYLLYSTIVVLKVLTLVSSNRILLNYQYVKFVFRKFLIFENGFFSRNTLLHKVRPDFKFGAAISFMHYATWFNN